MAEFKPFNPTEFLSQQTPPPQGNPAGIAGAPAQYYNNQNPSLTNTPPPQEARGPVPHQQAASQYGHVVPPQPQYQRPTQSQPPPAQGFEGNPQYQGGTYSGKQNYQRTPKGQENYHFKAYLTWSPKNQKEGMSLKLTDTGRRFLKENLDLIDGIRLSEFEDAKDVVRQEGLYGKRMTGMGWFKLIQEPGQQYQNNQYQGQAGGYNG